MGKNHSRTHRYLCSDNNNPTPVYPRPFFSTVTEKIESADVTNDVNAILSNIHDEFGNLESSASDYGGGMILISFVNGDNPAYVTDNLVNSTYDGLHLNFIVITNTSNTIVYGQSFNLTDHRISPLPRDLGQALVTAPALQNLRTLPRLRVSRGTTYDCPGGPPLPSSIAISPAPR